MPDRPPPLEAWPLPAAPVPSSLERLSMLLLGLRLPLRLPELLQLSNLPACPSRPS